MLWRSRNIYACCALLALFLFAIAGFRSYSSGNSAEAENVWYEPVNNPQNSRNIKVVRKENATIVLQKDSYKLDVNNSKQKQQVISSILRNVENPAHNGTSRVQDGSDSGDCVKRDVALSKTPLPVTGLVSFPGSGNTWLRHLIQQMTGIGTSSVYCDGGLKARGFPCECERQKSKTIVVKTHEAKDFHLFKKVVLLVRNPYDAVLSYANFAKAGHTAHAPKQQLINASNRMFDHSLRWYVNLTRNTFGKFKGPVHVVQYEKLQTELAEELRKLATFLDVNVSDHDISCTVKIQEGNFHRRTSEAQHIEMLRYIFDKEKLLRLREGARTSEKVLKEFYKTDFYLGGPVEKVLFENS